MVAPVRRRFLHRWLDALNPNAPSARLSGASVSICESCRNYGAWPRSSQISALRRLAPLPRSRALFYDSLGEFAVELPRSLDRRVTDLEFLSHVYLGI